MQLDTFEVTRKDIDATKAKILTMFGAPLPHYGFMRSKADLESMNHSLQPWLGQALDELLEEGLICFSKEYPDYYCKVLGDDQPIVKSRAISKQKKRSTDLTRTVN